MVHDGIKNGRELVEVGHTTASLALNYNFHESCLLYKDIAHSLLLMLMRGMKPMIKKYR
jgi:thiamine phosphate synthase YjbQ (UPF0047 family)